MEKWMEKFAGKLLQIWNLSSKWMEVVLILLLALGLACTMLLSGCVANDSAGTQQQYAGSGAQAAPGDGSGAGAQQYAGNGTQYAGNQSGMMRNGRGAFGNITDAQRQQMAQALSAACVGKAAGDACTVQNAFGNAARGMNGTCSERNGALSCSPSGAGRRGGQNGTGAQPPGNRT